MTKKLLSFVIPAYNEEECVDLLYDALAALFNQLSAYDCEAIIVENGSHDTTYEKLLAIRARDPRFKILKLARNFMTDGGMTAGLHYASGDAAIMLSADLEDPLATILEFVKKWEEGYQNVYGVIRRRQGTWLRRFNSKMFYAVINKLTGGVIPRYVSDFRLIDRKVIDTVNGMNERTRMLRGIMAWTGFKTCGVVFDRGDRVAGLSKAHTMHVLKVAFRGIVAFSVVPLRLAIVLGLLLTAGSALTIGVMGFKALFLGHVWSDLSIILSFVSFMFGILFILIGILSEYVGMAFEEVKARPNFIVEQAVGFDGN